MKLTYGPAKLGQKPQKLGGGLAYKPKKNKQFSGGIGEMPHKPKPGGVPGPGGSKSRGHGKIPRGDFPTGPLSYKDFLREMHAAENLQFDPLQRQLGREENASNFRRTQEDPAWFAQYKADVANLGNQTQSAYQNAQNSIQNFSQQQGAQDAAGRQALTQQLTNDAAMRGTTVDPSVIANGQNAEAARQNTIGTLHGVIAGQGANQAAYSNTRQAIGSQFQREAQQKELARMLGIESDQRELQQKRGDFRTQYRADTRDSERKYNLGRATIKGENSRAQLSANTSTANNKRTTSTSRLNAQLQAATSSGNARLAAKIRKQIANEQQRGEKQRNRADNKQSNLNSQRSAKKKKH